MKHILIILVSVILVFSSFSVQASDKNLPYICEDITAAMEKAFDWQISNFPKSSRHDATFWRTATLLIGATAAYQSTGNPKYLDTVMEMSNESQWKLGRPERHADYQTIGQVYAEVYEIKKDPEMIRDIKEVFDEIAAEPMYPSVVGWNRDLNWAWCDALFMAPPAFARLAAITGNRKYLDVMSKHWHETTKALYDYDEHLYYRDARFKNYIGGVQLKSKHGKKIFWARGNGWVFAGLARVLQYMPEDYRRYDRFVELFEQMAEKLASIQQQDGLWRTSLLDPQDYPTPESSSTALFCYGFAWGINAGILNKQKYLPVVEKAWQGLLWTLDDSGKMGWIQPAGSQPRLTYRDQTEVYGAGAFLLAGSEVIKLAVEKTVTSIPDGKNLFFCMVTNPTDEQRNDELIMVKLPQDALDGRTMTVARCENKILPSQLEDLNFDGIADTIAFLIDLGPRETTKVQIQKLPQGRCPEFTQEAHAEISVLSDKPEAAGGGVAVDGGHYISKKSLVRNPENKSSAYRFEGPLIESDKVGYRLYWDRRGAVDVYGKISDMLVGKNHTHKKSHHTMQPWGRDLLHNGEALGVGGLGIGKDSDRFSPSVAPYAEIIVGSDGPIRASYRMIYKNVEYQGKNYDLAWDISISAGKRFIKHNVTVTSGGRLDTLATITNHLEQKNMTQASSIANEGRLDWVATYGEQVFGDNDPVKAAKSNEKMGLALLWNHSQLQKLLMNETEFQAVYKPAEHLEYYSLAAYNGEKGTLITAKEEFYSYINKLADKLANPIEVKVLN